MLTFSILTGSSPIKTDPDVQTRTIKYTFSILTGSSPIKTANITLVWFRWMTFSILTGSSPIKTGYHVWFATITEPLSVSLPDRHRLKR